MSPPSLVASQVPSGAIATVLTPPPPWLKAAFWVQLAVSQIRTVPSLPPLAVASQVPSGAIATACALAWGLKAAFWVQLAVSQIRTVPPLPLPLPLPLLAVAVASQVPSGAIATACAPAWAG